jgi:hypothetical protein
MNSTILYKEKMIALFPAVLLIIWTLPSLSFGQNQKCRFEPNGPSLAGARIHFEAGNIPCALTGLDSIIALSPPDSFLMANVHMYRAYIYYYKELPEQEISDEIQTALEYSNNAANIPIVTENEDFHQTVLTVHDRMARELVAIIPEKEHRKKMWWKSPWAIVTGVAVAGAAVYFLTRPGDNKPDTSRAWEFPPPPDN